MALDFFNCLLEFICVLIFFLALSGNLLRYKNLFIYSALSLIASLLFVFADPPLLFNIALYLLIPTIAFPENRKDNLTYMAVSVLAIIYLQFMFYSMIPHFLLQTYWGNLINNLSVLLVLAVLFIFSTKYKLPITLRPLFLRHRVVVLLLLFFSCFLGQFYLSRLSVFWTYLPGLVAIIIFFLAVAFVFAYVYHARSTDRLQVQLLMRNIDNTEVYITSLRIQNHDYKHHIANLRNQVSTASDLETLKRNISTYIDQMDQDRRFVNTILNIDQPILRASLYGCYTRCIQNNIDFQFNATDLLPNFPLKDYQLAEILENLTSNAIEHNLTLPSLERKLHISFQSLDGRNEITISNPVKDNKADLSDMLKLGYSSKDSSHSGIGLFNIKQLAMQNHMQFYGKHTDKFVSFTLLYEEERNICCNLFY